MKKRIVVYIILIQIIVISVLVLNIYQKKKQVLGLVSVTPINKEQIVSSLSGTLKYYYEPYPGINTINVSYLGDEFNYSVKYSITPDTLNQLVEYPVQKKEGIFRIIALGDSFTFGVHLNTEENYPSQLQNMLNSCKSGMKFEVTNLGVGGYDLQYAVQRYVLRGMRYNPDLVLWALVSDDFLRFNEKIIPLESKYSKEMHKNNEFEKLRTNKLLNPAQSKAEKEIIEGLGGWMKHLRCKNHI